MNSIRFPKALGVVFGFLLVPLSWGQVPWTEMQELVGEERGSGDQFGADLALRGDLLVVGAPSGWNEAGNRTGVVHLFNARRGEWLGLLAPPDGEPGDRFGASLAMAGSLVAVGAPGAAGPNGKANQGKVHLFAADSLELERTLEIPPDGGDEGAGFGAELHYDSGRLYVLSRTFQDTPSARVYEWDPVSGQLLTTYTPTGTGGGFSIFPSSFAVSGERVLIGASERVSFLTYENKVRIYERGNGQSVGVRETDLGQETTFAVLATDGERDYFLVLDERIQIRDAETNEILGTLEQPGDDPPDREFGEQLVMNGGIAVVSAPATPFPGPGGSTFFRGPGAVHLFAENNLELLGSLQPAGLQDGAQFGSRIAVSGTHLAAAAAARESGSGLAGSVFVWSVPETGPGAPELDAVNPGQLAVGGEQGTELQISGSNFAFADVEDYRIHAGDGVELEGADADGWAPVRFVDGSTLAVTVAEVDLFAATGSRDVVLRYGAGAADRVRLPGGLVIGPFVPESGIATHHPADSNRDGRIRGGELADFAFYAPQGGMPGVPVGEEADYVASAERIWKNGELYRQLSGVSLPGAWVPDPEGGADWIAVEQRQVEALDRLRLYGLPPAESYLVQVRPMEGTATALAMAIRNPEGYWELPGPIHPLTPTAGGEVDITFYADADDPQSRYRLGILDLIPPPAAAGELDRVLAESDRLLREMETALGVTFSDYYNQPLEQVPADLRLLVALGRLVEDGQMEGSLAWMQGQMEADPALVEELGLGVVDSLLAQSGLLELLQNSGSFGIAPGAASAAPMSSGAERTRDVGPRLSPADIASCTDLKAAIEEQDFHEGFKDDQVVSDMLNAGTFLGFLGAPGAAAGAALSTPALLGKIRSEYIAGTYPSFASMQLEVELDDLDYNETTCSPTSEWSLKATCSSRGYRLDGAIVDVLLQAAGSLDVATDMLKAGRAASAGNKAEAAVGVVERRIPNARGDTVRAAVSDTSTPALQEFAKAVRTASETGLFTIDPEIFGPIELEEGECAEAKSLLGKYSFSGNEFSPIAVGEDILSFYTIDFISQKFVNVPEEVKQSRIRLEAAAPSIAAGEQVIITAYADNIDGDQGVNWTVEDGSFQVTKDGANDGVSEIVFTAPNRGEASFQVGIEATSRADFCLPDNAGPATGSLYMPVGNEYEIQVFPDPSCLAEGNEVFLTLVDVTQGVQVPGQFTLASGSGLLGVLSESEAVYQAPEESTYVVVEAVPDDSPSLVLRTEFPAQCDKSGVLLITMDFMENVAGKEYVFEEATRMFGEIGFGEGPDTAGAGGLPLSPFAIDFGSLFGTGSISFSDSGLVEAFTFYAETGEGTIHGGSGSIAPTEIAVTWSIDGGQGAIAELSGGLNGTYETPLNVMQFRYLGPDENDPPGATGVVTIGLPLNR